MKKQIDSKRSNELSYRLVYFSKKQKQKMSRSYIVVLKTAAGGSMDGNGAIY